MDEAEQKKKWVKQKWKRWRQQEPRMEQSEKLVRSSCSEAWSVLVHGLKQAHESNRLPSIVTLFRKVQQRKERWQ